MPKHWSMNGLVGSALIIGTLLAVSGSARAQSFTVLECRASAERYYVRINPPSFLSRFRNNDMRSDSIEIRHASEGEFRATNVTQSDENGVTLLVTPALRGAPPDATFSTVTIRRTAPSSGIISHHRRIVTGYEGTGKYRRTLTEDHLIGPLIWMSCNRHESLF